MRIFNGFRLIIAMIVVISLFSACSPASSASQNTTPAVSPTPGVEIIMAAPFDMERPLKEIAISYKRQTGNKVTFVFGTPEQLAAQLENGARYDLFASTNLAIINDLEKKGLIEPKSITPYAYSQIVLIGNSAAKIASLSVHSLLLPQIKHIAIANPESDSGGKAARQALESAGILDKVSEKIIFAENSQQALQFVQSGQADAGIVEFLGAGGTGIIWTPVERSLYQPVGHILALTSNSEHKSTALSFVMLLKSIESQTILRGYGLMMPSDVPEINVPQP